MSIATTLLVVLPGHLDRDLLGSLIVFDMALAAIIAALAAVMVAELRRGLHLLGTNLPPALFDAIIDRVAKLSDDEVREGLPGGMILKNGDRIAGRSLKRSYRIFILVGEYVFAFLVIFPPTLGAFLAFVAQVWGLQTGVWLLGSAALALTVWTPFGVVYLLWVLYEMRAANVEASTKIGR